MFFLSRPVCITLAFSVLLGSCAHRTEIVMPNACAVPRIYPATPGEENRFDEDISLNHAGAATYEDMKHDMGEFHRDLGIWLSMTNQAVRDNDGTRTRCAIAWLDTWAQGGHMENTPQGTRQMQDRSRQETIWALQSLATPYALSLRRQATRSERRHIDRWLNRLAKTVEEHEIEDVPPARHTTRFLEANAAIMAAGVATEDEDLVRTAHKAYTDGVDAILPDGSLSYIHHDSTDALRQHARAITPLTLMAEFARHEGQNWGHYKPERLPRLVDFVLHGVNNPHWADGYFGKPQDTNWMETCSDDWGGWTPFWYRYDAQRVSRVAPPPGRCSWWRLGGDLSLLKSRGLFEPAGQTMHTRY